jgi:hypothetical protein
VRKRPAQPDERERLARFGRQSGDGDLGSRCRNQREQKRQYENGKKGRETVQG